MSKLRVVTRALSHCEEWREILQAACAIHSIECTEQLSFQVTYALADSIQVDEETLLVNVSGIDDAAVLAAVEARKPQPTPEPDITPEPEPEE